MRLGSFSFNEDFAAALNAVGAKLERWDPGPVPLPTPVAERLEKGVIPVDRSTRIPTDESGLLTYKGHKVVIYIRDQHAWNRGGRPRSWKQYSSYKFHLTNCETLQGMQSSGRYQKRYVYTNRRDGQFVVNKIASGQVVERDVLIKMYICMNCWNNLRQYGVVKKLRTSPTRFRLEDYFAHFDTQVQTLPTHTPTTAPENIYSEDQKKFAALLKYRCGYKCHKCGCDFSDHKKWLHMHHIDGDKSNNAYTNLAIYCLACHAEEPSHQHMKSNPEYKAALLARESLLNQ